MILEYLYSQEILAETLGDLLGAYLAGPRFPEALQVLSGECEGGKDRGAQCSRFPGRTVPSAQVMRASNIDKRDDESDEMAQFTNDGTWIVISPSNS